MVSEASLRAHLRFSCNFYLTEERLPLLSMALEPPVSPKSLKFPCLAAYYDLVAIQLIDPTRLWTYKMESTSWGLRLQPIASILL